MFWFYGLGVGVIWCLVYRVFFGLQGLVEFICSGQFCMFFLVWLSLYVLDSFACYE